MSLIKPTVDAYTLECPIDNALAPAEFTICMWLKATDAFTSTQTLCFNRDTAVRGWFLRFVNATTISLTYVGSDTVNETSAFIHGAAVGVWSWWLFSVDSSGNVRWRRDNTTGTTSQTHAPRTSGNCEKTRILTHQNTNGLKAEIADWRFYNRPISITEELIIMHGQGRDGIIDGLASRLLFNDADPTVDTDTTVPIDAADPSRAWTVSGAGDAYTYSDGPYPIRRRRR
jgi:hypothetical protein